MKKLLSFRGRARRKEYWAVALIIAVIGYVLEAAFAPENAEGGMLSIYLILNIPVIWVSVATAARRCHDLGHNGWWQLIPFYTIWMGFVNGQKGRNQYGANPKGE